MRHHLGAGFTLIELMVTVAVVAVLAAIAIPSFTDSLARRRLEGAANELSTDLQFARSQAVSNNANITLSTTASGYTIAGAQTYRTQALASGLSMSNGVSVTFTPLRGCTSDNCSAADLSITISSSQVSSTLKVSVNNMGRVQLCSPGGTFGGYASC